MRPNALARSDLMLEGYSYIYALPVGTHFLIYAPLHNFAALVNRAAVVHLRDALAGGRGITDTSVWPDDDLAILAARPKLIPSPKTGPFSPMFLGLLPTRRCNFACRYCDFTSLGSKAKNMDLALAREAINWYINLVEQNNESRAEIHYFGGEPFCAAGVLDFTVPFAKMRAAQVGCDVRFEVSTNGALDENHAYWAADVFDTIILSLDGLADIQNDYRPYKDGGQSFPTVHRTARIFSEGSGDLFLRCCVTAQTTRKMTETAHWFCDQYRPQGVCFEPLQPSPQTHATGLEPPDAWDFAVNFIRAAEILEAYGVQSICATADIHKLRVSFCPVAQDTAIISPDGDIQACYLLPDEWERRGMNLRLGHIKAGSPELDMDNVEAVRTLNVWNKPFCARCFAKWHCAGGCHVNHVLPDRAMGYDRLCIQTRILTLRNILHALDRDDLVHLLLENRTALESTILQPSDILANVEFL